MISVITRFIFLLSSIFFIVLILAMLNNHFNRELMYSSDLPHGNLICLHNEWNDAYLCVQDEDDLHPFAPSFLTTDVVPRVGRLDHEGTYLSSTNGGITLDQ